MVTESPAVQKVSGRNPNVKLCQMGKLPCDLVARHAVMDRGWELVWRVFHSTLLVLVLLLWVEGC